MNASESGAVTAAEAPSDEAEQVQVLEFELGPETYCVDIEHVSEIVDMGELTEIPNAPPHVEGVMDLRGRTTAIVNPKSLLGVRDDGEGKRIVIFDSETLNDDGTTGWLVDEVFQVVRVSLEDVEDPPAGGDEAVEGIIRRDDELVVWVTPEAGA